MNIFGEVKKKTVARPSGIPIPAAREQNHYFAAGYSMPVMQFRNKSVVTYLRTESDGSKGLQLFRSLNMKAQQEKAYSGKFTAGAKKRCTKAINLMVQGTRRRWITNPITKRMQLHQLSFITLTVNNHNGILTGKEAYSKLLSHFLSWLRKTKAVTTYIWKAELQENGQIHYHITCPDFIDYREIRAKWNALQRKAGLLEAYHKEHGHYDPNSTDIHSVHNQRDMAAYMVKEIAKNVQNEESIGGKVWDCSVNLSKGKYFSVEMKQQQFEYLESAVNEGLCTKYEGEQFCIYKFNASVVQEALLTKEDMKHYKTWLHVLRDSITYQDPELENENIFYA